MDYLASWWWWTLLLVVPTFAVVGLELFGPICLHLGFEIDLLSFALTYKIISKVIIPDHLELRHLCCDFRRISLRERLVQLPAIASRMVSLELIAEPRSPTPSSFPPTLSSTFLKPSYLLTPSSFAHIILNVTHKVRNADYMV